MARDETKLAELRACYERATALRGELGIQGEPGEVIWQADQDVDRKLVVEADGLGGARVVVVEGNYPVDYRRIRGKDCTTEDQAEQLASHILDGLKNDQEVLDEA